MMAPHAARSRTAYTLIALSFVLLVVTILTLARLENLVATNYKGCVTGNELRADARLLLARDGFPGKAKSPALRERPCKDLYQTGIRSLIPFL